MTSKNPKKQRKPPPNCRIRCFLKKRKKEKVRPVFTSPGGHLQGLREQWLRFRFLQPVASELRVWQSALHHWHLVTSPQACVTLLICILGFPNTFLCFHTAKHCGERRHFKRVLRKTAFWDSARGPHSQWEPAATAGT